MIEITTSFSAIGMLLFEKRKTRIIMSFFSLFLIISITGILIYTFTTVHDKEKKDYILNTILPFFFVPLGVISFLFISYLSSKVSNKEDIQLEKLREERIEITQKIEKEKELDIFHTIQLSLNQLNEYYTINKSQAKSSFRFSIFSIVLGLLTISIGIWFHYLDNTKIELAFITGISGVLLEFIGGAYFFMYKKSLEQVNFFFGQLIKIQDTMLSINLASNIKNEDKKTEVNEKIIASLLERSLK